MDLAAISLLRVSREMGIFKRVRNAAKTGASRAHSSSALTAEGTWARGFCADVDQVGAVTLHLQSVLHGLFL